MQEAFLLLFFSWPLHLIEYLLASPGKCWSILKFFLFRCFFSFICAKFIFSENKTNICKLRENKDVQNKVLNVYCTLYNLCL